MVANGLATRFSAPRSTLDASTSRALKSVKPEWKFFKPRQAIRLVREDFPEVVPRIEEWLARCG